MPDQKTCFVVMGFGEKTDYETQRTLDLDKSYEYIIKPAVESCNVKCVRADEIIHSGLIDKPMYEQLLDADIVIADLSTSNQNAIYELGVRHALRPNTTIVIAEDKFHFPFDLGHVLIRPYKHLGTGIDFGEVERMRAELVEVIDKTLTSAPERDSPVYEFLRGLKAPQLAGSRASAAPAAPQEKPENEAVFGVLLGQAQQAMKSNDFATAKVLFGQLREIQVRETSRADAYVLQQQALATYKHKQPDEREALLEARNILADNLQPGTTNDPETLGLWGAIHKRLWDIEGDREMLDTAIWSYERGFYLKRDYYNGINYAFMLNVRAAIQADEEDAITDRVLAKRIRREVLSLVDEAESELPVDKDGKPADAEAAYWIAATRLEALLGLGEQARLEDEAEKLFENAPAPWMPDSTRSQLDKLRDLL